MSEAHVIDLPLRTSQTKTGPIIRVTPDTVVLSYDFEADDGTIIWARVRFTPILAVRFRIAAVCDVTDLDGYKHMIRYASSDWAASIVTQRHINLGDQATGAAYWHYRIYFDDAGCLDVVAGDHEVDSSSYSSAAD